MPRYNDFALSNWIENNSARVEVSLAGSTGPGITLNELSKISKDPAATREALEYGDLKLVGGTGDFGGERLRHQIAALYDQKKVKVTADDVVVANGTTGANLLVLQSLISPGDHVVCMYPTYAALLEIPRSIGADMSYWRMSPDNGWKASLEELETLLKPNTRLLILNNPHNPTGSILSTSEQADILRLASKHNIIVHADEIFRPLFHVGEAPTSILEHEFYNRTIATGSVSKAWCFSGIRVGWCVTRNRELQDILLNLRQWTLQSTSMVDEIIAQEVLNERCRGSVHSRISNFAHENLIDLKSFCKSHTDTVSCVLPNGGSTAFVKFSNPETGLPVDDMEFCKQLQRECSTLLSPGSLCFGQLRDGDWMGYVRLHFTIPPENFKEGLKRISKFIATESFLSIGHKGHRNGEGSNGTAK